MKVMQVSVHEAKKHLPRLLKLVLSGVDVTIMKAGKPMARLVAAEPAPRQRQLGWAAGEFVVPDDFDDPLPSDIEESFCR